MTTAAATITAAEAADAATAAERHQREQREAVDAKLEEAKSHFAEARIRCDVAVETRTAAAAAYRVANAARLAAYDRMVDAADARQRVIFPAR